MMRLRLSVGVACAVLALACGSASEEISTAADEPGAGPSAASDASVLPVAEPQARPVPPPAGSAGPVVTGGACAIDADCVPASCCHPATCVDKARAPACGDAMCTLDCRGGTMDCGGGSCVCQDGQCAARLTGMPAPVLVPPAAR